MTNRVLYTILLHPKNKNHSTVVLTGVQHHQYIHNGHGHELIHIHYAQGVTETYPTVQYSLIQTLR